MLTDLLRHDELDTDDGKRSLQTVNVDNIMNGSGTVEKKQKTEPDQQSSISAKTIHSNPVVIRNEDMARVSLSANWAPDGWPCPDQAYIMSILHSRGISCKYASISNIGHPLRHPQAIQIDTLHGVVYIVENSIVTWGTQTWEAAAIALAEVDRAMLWVPFGNDTPVDGRRRQPGVPGEDGSMEQLSARVRFSSASVRKTLPKSVDIVEFARKPEVSKLAEHDKYSPILDSLNSKWTLFRFNPNDLGSNGNLPYPTTVAYFSLTGELVVTINKFAVIREQGEVPGYPDSLPYFLKDDESFNRVQDVLQKSVNIMFYVLSRDESVLSV
tara:strand:- start:430 stop:1410 length:981 start_codon:yes stop_codon:yes gene_type:complete